MKTTFAVALLALLLGACTVPATQTQRTSPPTEENAPAQAPAQGAPKAPSAPAAPKAPAPVEVVTQAPSAPPTVCVEHGVKGGAVALYPRVIPRQASPEVDALADQLQARVKQTIGAAMPGAPISTCPKPQRVCPQGGCDGLGVGILLLHKGDGCAALALINTPGRSVINLVQWAGKTELKQTRVDYREPPESQVIIEDFVPCAELIDSLQENEARVVQAIQTNANLVKQAQ